MGVEMAGGKGWSRPTADARSEAWAARLTDGELAGELKRIAEPRSANRKMAVRRAILREAARRLTNPNHDPLGAP